jgi:TP901 family phage tail tape measure protein
MGKKIVDEDMRLNIKINGNEAKNELFELEEKVRDLRAENDKLEKSIDKYGKQIERNEKQVAKYTKTLEKERENVERQEKTYASARSSITAMYATYKKLDQAGKESKYGQRLLEDIRKQEEIIRRSGEAGRKSVLAVENLEKSLKGLEAENTKLIKRCEEDTATLKRNKVELEANSGKVEKLRKNLDITTLSIEELNREITKTGALFRRTDPNDPKWKEYQKTLVSLRKRHSELSAQAQATHGFLCRVADGVNKYWNLVVSGMASFTGIIFGIKSAINKYVEFTDVIADVQKTTNLVKEEVIELNEELKKYDTRSAQDELMGLARIGGKLGIEGRDNILGFVRAADKINVALKEDLGGDTEEAIRQVGKIVDIFKVNDQFGIEAGMLKVGSVINELGMASTANEGYIVEFTKRVAGIAPITNVQVPAVMGLAATLDKFGQTSEVSSTVYSQVMTQMFKKTGTYAKIAGMEIKEFSGLLHRDANEAFLRVMEGLRGNEGEIEKMIASMGDMGMEGKRAVGVLGVLANNTEVLRAQQRLANEAFDEGISLTNEFEVKNSNLAAQRAKAKKDLDERIKQLGEKLYPLMTHGMSLMRLTVSTLELLVDLITKHGGKILWLTGVLGTYWTVQKGVVAWRRIEETLITKAIALGMAEANGVKVMTAAKVVFVGAVKKATVAMKAFLLSLVTNPVGIITLSILSLGTAFYKAYQIIDDTTGGIRRSLKRVQEAQREFARESTMEQMAIDRLFGKLDALTKGTSEYQKVKDEILSKYGQYLNGLSAEIQALDDVKGAYEAISTAAKQAARDRAIDTATTKATEAYVEVEVENLEKIREALQKTFDSREAARYFEQIKAAMQEGGTIPEDLQQLIDETFTTEHVLFMDKFTSHIYKTNPVQEAINAIRAGKTTLQREIDSVNELLANVGGRKNNVDPLGLESDMEVIDYVSPKGGNTSSIENQMIALKDRYAQRLIMREEYENKLDALELAHLEYRLKNEDLNEEKRVELRQKIADKKLEIAEKARRKEERVDAIIEAKSDPVLKEENAYWKRLEEAGLFGKKREDLTEKQLQALEILEREHEANKDKILKDARKKQTEEYMKGIDERIKNLQLGQSMEIMELQMAQSAELEGFSGSLFQRQELLKEHQRQELALSETHAGEMMALLGEIFGEIEGKEGGSGEMVLTEQQKNELKKRLAEVGLSLSKLKISRQELDKKKQADFDVLGMNASKWEEFFNNLRQGKAGIEEIEFAVGALGNAWSAYTKLRAVQTQKELKQYEQKTKREKAELDKQLDSGQISQEQYNARVSQLDADLDAKKEKLEKEQRERERTQAIFSTTVSTAVAVAKAWELGPILGPILAALAAAMGVVQIATIKAAQYATGKYPVIGEDDGRRYEANYVGNRIQTGVYDQPTLGLFSEKEPEMVVDGNTTRKLILNYPRVYRSIIDISRGRVPQFAGGRYPTDSSMISSGTFDVGGSDPAMNRLLEKNIEMMNRLMNMEFSIPMYGNGLVKKIKKAQDYEQSTKTGRRV